METGSPDEDGKEPEPGEQEEQGSDDDDGDEDDMSEEEEEDEEDEEDVQLKHKEPSHQSSDVEPMAAVSVIVPNTDPSPLAAMQAAFSHSPNHRKKSKPVADDPSSNAVMKLHSLVEAVERGSSLKPKRSSSSMLFSKPMTSCQTYSSPSKSTPLTATSSMESTLKRIYSTYLPAGASRPATVSPSPSPDPNEPLDLSTKAKPAKGNGRTQDKADSPRTKKSNKSSLDALEKKFGGDSAILERVGSRPLGSNNRNAFMSAFGVNLYSSALYSTHSMLPSTPFQRFLTPSSASVPYTSLKATDSLAPRKPPREVTTTTSSQSSRQCSQVSPKRASELSSSEKATQPTFQSHSPKYLSHHSPGSSSESLDPESKKHTSLLCSCGADFETLYRLTLHLNETGHPPNRTKQAVAQEYPKLVRGQDMWLNQGSEQTRQILRCMQCGESFKTLPELTVHMIQTKHYTNIVGTEPQKKNSAKTSSGSVSECSDNEAYMCKMCSLSFDDLDALQYHIGVSGHHKKSFSRQRQRSKGDHSDSSSVHSPRPDDVWEQKERRSNASTPSVDETPPRGFSREMMEREDFLAAAAETSTIRCENCGEKIETPFFVEHVRLCVKNKPAVTSASPAKHSKKHFDYTKYLPSYMNGQSKVKAEDKESEVNSSSDLVLPPATSSAGSALQDMESFIERSFTASKAKKKHFFNQASKLFTSQMLSQAMGHNRPSGPSPPPRPRSRESPTNSCLGPSSGLYQNKYLPPSYMAPPASSSVKQESPSPAPSTEDAGEELKNGEASPERQEDRSPTEVKDKNDNDMHKLLSPKKEVDEEVTDKVPSQSDGQVDRKDAPSPPNTALDSLQGLVYGKSLKKSEHPLDSLQKLIHSTQNPATTDSRPPVTSSLSQSLPGTVILVNPIVTVMPNGTTDSPSIQISIPPKSPSNADTPPSDDERDADSDSDQSGEYHCGACKRTLASKGAYRYHLSRCHVLKYGIKDAIHTSPYVYLPLDHTAKFNKYYEMAHELASKGK
ncbi:hypothetical protein CAPTEDRAFT_197857 [Capitella teleta]|uniref:C2H2-type domain-containing protein n=1 Tax=Capitella teleta TaxID=283909 RepID=R7T352_CAPTE|nr:hypothetical protein CAPTEDRAFT_197857 [Capitella teleta]|eukprot:ELT87082.1 hypothetical protein CAPTEDRAFT_197857 [Capitella teleta]